MLTRFQIGFDVHGDMQDKPTVDAFFKFADLWKPKIRICGGDLWDMRPLRAGANEDERRETMREDYQAGVQWFDRFKPTHFLRGNHDERIWKLAEADRGVASDYAAQLIGEIEAMVKRHRCVMLPYHKREGVLQLGDYRILHGFSNGIHASRATALVYGSCAFGHCHMFDQHPVPGLEKRVAQCGGCLCRTDMDYNSRQMNTLRQENGWLYGVSDDRSGDHQVWQARRMGDKWLLPSEFIEL